MRVAIQERSVLSDVFYTTIQKPKNTAMAWSDCSFDLYRIAAFKKIHFFKDGFSLHGNPAKSYNTDKNP